MSRYATAVAVLGLFASLAPPAPVRAHIGHVRVVIAKASLVAGVGAGRGVLTFRGRHYPFRVAGLSLGLAVGASVNRLVGRVSYMDDVSEFPGIYSAVGAGGALAGGAGGVQLRNEKGVMITLRGAKAGLELSANLTEVRISFE